MGTWFHFKELKMKEYNFKKSLIRNRGYFEFEFFKVKIKNEVFMTSNHFEIGLLGVGKKIINLIIPQICYIFNGVQKYYKFSPEKSLNILEEKSRLTRKELISLAMNNIDIDSKDLFFLIHNYKDDLNWFCTNPINKISLYSTFGWETISTEIGVIYSIGSSMIQVLQYYEVFKKKKYKTSQKFLERAYSKYMAQKESQRPLLHFETKGCLNDFCNEKPDKIFKMRTGDVCSDCIKIWEEILSQPQIDALFEMIEAIRIRSVVNKSNIRVRSYCRELITYIEKRLHNIIFERLKELYGENWWIRGIPKNTRKKIAQNYEENDCIGDKFDYTYIWDLAQIWKVNITQFSDVSPFLKWGTNNKAIDMSFAKFNTMRNKLMHPARDYLPSDDDRKFLENFAQKIFS